SVDVWTRDEHEARRRDDEHEERRKAPAAHDRMLSCNFMLRLIIAIDGPSGAGKGTVARTVASELGYRHVDSGAMYRAIGWKALRDRVPLDDEAAGADLAKGSPLGVAPPEVFNH